MRLTRVKPKAILIAFSLIITFIGTAPSQATSIGTGNCVQNVGSTANVTVSTYSNRCVIIFKSTTPTTWDVPIGVTSAWVLVVGGGGGGGNDEGGGGGGGGYVEKTNHPLISGSQLTVTVGTGGAGALLAGDLAGSDGGDSSLGSLVAKGGGGGGSAVPTVTVEKNGRAGGSGGGGSGESPVGTAGSGTAGQGYAGSNGFTARGGGGGGASAASSTSAGAAGLANRITDGTTLITYAGGGSGGGGNTTSGSLAGGSGGGGSGGGLTVCPTAGTANTGGGGGGGAGPSCATNAGYAGGSGIVIINYQFDITAPTLTSGTTYSAAENISTSTAAATLQFNESTTASISSGLDIGDFTISWVDSQSAQIKFIASPDYESPDDSNGDNAYQLTISMQDLTGNSSTQAITITVTDVTEAVVINFANITGTVYKGVSKSIVVNLNAAGKVRYFANGKRIAKCLSISTVGSGFIYSATCNWIPTVSGIVKLSATITPTGNTFTSATSPVFLASVQKRMTTR